MFRWALVSIAILRATTRTATLRGLISVDISCIVAAAATYGVVRQLVSGDKVARKKALIVKFGQIGDVIMAIPAVRSLYEQGFEIHWVCGRAAQPLLECYSWITLIPVNDKAILLGGALERGKQIARLWRKVSFKGYDLFANLSF